MHSNHSGFHVRNFQSSFLNVSICIQVQPSASKTIFLRIFLDPPNASRCLQMHLNASWSIQMHLRKSLEDSPLEGQLKDCPFRFFLKDFLKDFSFRTFPFRCTGRHLDAFEGKIHMEIPQDAFGRICRLLKENP